MDSIGVKDPGKQGEAVSGSEAYGAALDETLGSAELSRGRDSRAGSHEWLALSRISQLLLGHEPLPDVFGRVVEEIASATGFPVVVIELYDADRQVMMFEGVTGIPLPPNGTGHEVPVTETVSGLVATTGRSYISEDVWNHPQYRCGRLRDLGIHTFICTPMRAEDRILGTLSLAHTDVVPVDENLPAFASALANQIGLFIEHRQTEESLCKSEERFHMFVDWTYDWEYWMNPDGTILYMSPSCERITGYSPGAFSADPTLLDRIVHPDDRDGWFQHLKGIVSSAFPSAPETIEFRIVCLDGSERRIGHACQPVFDRDGRYLGRRVSNRDITDEFRFERERETSLELLRLLNQQNHTEELLQNLTGLFHDWTGCEAVGVRLREGDDFPYYVTRGFPQEFIRAERYLCQRDLEGQLVRDSSGNPMLECMCGNILCGRFNPQLPFFTEYGSFWTNSTTQLLASTSESDRQARTRNRCNGEGYESVALIPIRYGSETLGLLQLNDRAPGRFNAELIPFLERMAGQIALALAQRQTSVRLTVSEKRFRDISEASGECVFETDAAGRITFVNDRVVDVLGYLPENALGHSVYEVLPEECGEACRRALAPRDGTRTGFRGMEIQARSKDGREVWLSVTVMPLLSDSGKVTGFRGTAMDITERKRTEKALRESEARHRTILQTAMDGFWLVDLEGRLLEVNSAYCRMSGYTEAELLAMRIPDLEAVETATDTAAHMRKVMTEGQDRFETRHRHKDGHFFDVEVSVQFRPEEGGRLVVFLRDITERKQTEAGLRRLASAVEQAAECVVVTDPSGTIEYVNPAFETITGYRSEEVIGQNPRVLKSGKQDQGFYEALWKTISAGSVWRGGFVNRRKDGTLYQEDATISPVKDADGRIVHFVAVKRDITRETDLEEQLRQSQKMEAVGMLAGGIAHDFNNLLQVITGYSEMIFAQLPENGPHTEYLNEVTQAAERARHLIGQLLVFSRKQPRNPGYVRMTEVVDGCMKMLGRVLGEHIEREFETPADISTIYADPNQVEQVLMNLCVNSRDAMPSGGKLTVRLAEKSFDSNYCNRHAWARPGDFVMLSVTDTGTGMTPEIIAHMFEPFFSTKAPGKGTGLGLATVYGIIQQHEGLIQVESEPGRGTTFNTYWPTSKGDARQSHTDLPLEPGVQGQGENILIVEDDENVRSFTTKILSNNGYVPITAKDGTEAIRLFRKQKNSIALVISDVVMPKRSGRKMAKDIRALSPNVPILMMSGYVPDDLDERELPEGEEFLQKPFRPRELLDKVRTLLAHEKR